MIQCERTEIEHELNNINGKVDVENCDGLVVPPTPRKTHIIICNNKREVSPALEITVVDVEYKFDGERNERDGKDCVFEGEEDHHRRRLIPRFNSAAQRLMNLNAQIKLYQSERKATSIMNKAPIRATMRR